MNNEIESIKNSVFTQTTKQLVSLGSLVQDIDSTISFDETLALVVKKISRVMHSERTSVFLVEEDSSLVSRVLQDEEILKIKLNPGQGLVGWTARHAIPLLINDAYNDERFDKEFDQKSGYETKQVLCHPISGKAGQVIGVVEILNSTRGKFDQEDVMLLEVVSNQLSMVIENSRTIVDLSQKNQVITEAKLNLENRNHRLEIMLELEKVFARSDNMESLGQHSFEKILEIMGSSLGSLYIVDEENITKWVYLEDGSVNSVIREGTGMGFTGWVANKKSDLMLKEPKADPRYEASISNKTGIEIDNLIACPLVFPEESNRAGAIMVCNSKKNTGYTDTDMMILRLIASQMGTAVTHLMERTNREREHRLATVGRLLAGVLHDLKTPMTTISGYAQLMAETSDVKENTGYLRHINRALERIKNMTADIISFSRGERKFLPSSVMLDEFIEDYRSNVSNYLKTHNVELVIRKRTSGAIKVDREKLLRAFHNITINAAEAMVNGGKLIFEVDRIDERLMFSFTDTGTGIPEAIQGNLFNSFVSFGKHEGTGLGLAVAREIITGHSGQISFTTFPGNGTTFLITLNNA